MRGDNELKTRGNHKQVRRGKQANPNSDNRSGIVYHDALRTKDSVTDIVSPYPRRGRWTYPKPGFIQWRNYAENIPNKVLDTRWQATMNRVIEQSTTEGDKRS